MEIDGDEIFGKACQIAGRVVYYLPVHTDRAQLRWLAKEHQLTLQLRGVLPACP